MSVASGVLRSKLRVGLIPAAAAAGATGMNYLLNLLLAERLPPGAFSDAALVVNLVLVAGVAAAALQLATATLVGRRHPSEAQGVVAALVRVAAIAGGGLAVLLAVSSGPISTTLHVVSPSVLVVLALTLPIFLLQAVHRGALQGRLRSGRLAASYCVEAGVRLVGSLVLIQLGAGPLGVTVAVAVSMIASFGVARTSFVRIPGPGAVPTPSWAEIRSAAGTALVLLAAQVLLLNTDVLLAKAWFSPTVAGSYAAGALLGRGVFFIAWSVAQSLLPVVIASHAVDSGRRQTGRSLMIVIACFAAVGAAVAALLAGPASALLPLGYSDTAPLLVPQAIAGGALAVATVSAALEAAADRPGSSYALVVGAGLNLSASLAIPVDATGLAWLHAGVLVATAMCVVLRRSLRVAAPVPSDVTHVPHPDPQQNRTQNGAHD